MFDRWLIGCRLILKQVTREIYTPDQVVALQQVKGLLDAELAREKAEYTSLHASLQVIASHSMRSCLIFLLDVHVDWNGL